MMTDTPPDLKTATAATFWTSVSWRWLLTPPPPHNIGRVEWIDALRAVVCVSVVLNHVGPPEPLLTIPAVSTTYSAFVTVRPGMECFMVLSGFMLGHLLRPRGDGPFSAVGFLSSRLIRLAIPFWIATTCGFVMFQLAILLGWKSMQPTAKDIVANYLFVNDLCSVKWLHVFHWSLVSLLQATVLWLGAFWVVRRLALANGVHAPHRQTVRILTGIAVALTALGGLFLIEERVWRGWQMPYVLTQLTAGWLAYQVAVGMVGRWVIAYVAGILVAVAALSNQYRMVMWVEATVAFLLVAGRAGDTRLPQRLRWLKPLARISFSVYLTHGLVEHRLFRLVKSLNGPPSAEVAFVLYIASLALIFAVAAVFNHYVERNVGVVTGWLPPRVRPRLPA